MKNITEEFDQIYLPVKAIVINTGKADNSKFYVEAYDFSSDGKPVNAHPLSVAEMQELAETLAASDELRHEHLGEPSWFPPNLLYSDPSRSGFAVWFTSPQKVNLLFKPSLKITSGKAHIPSLIWKADADNLWVFALKGKGRPLPESKIQYAPFFNIHEDGKVCMGTVNIEMEKASTIGEFMKRWENYFWNSYFSHLLGDRSPVNENIVSLWQGLIGTKQRFPENVLKPTKLTLNDLLK